MIVGRLGYQAVFLQPQTDVPCRLPIFRFRHDSVQQALTPYFLYHRIINPLHLTTEQLTHLKRILRQMLVTYHLQGGDSDFRRQRISTIRGTVLSRSDRKHDLIVRQYRRDRTDPTGQRLSQDQDIRANPLVIASQ